MRLLGIDPNGFAQRVQSQMIKLMANNRPESAQNNLASPSPSPAQATVHKVNVRNLPLPLSAQRAAVDQSPLPSQMSATGTPQIDPAATRAIAQFTETQPHLVGRDGQETAPSTAVVVPDTPAVLGAAQLAVGNKLPTSITTLANDLPGRIKAAVSALLKSHDAAIRTAAVLLLASGIAFAIAMA